MDVRELTEGQQIDLVLLVRERADGRVTLADRTASVGAVSRPSTLRCASRARACACRGAWSAGGWS